jgi:hypothetical protein
LLPCCCISLYQPGLLSTVHPLIWLRRITCHHFDSINSILFLAIYFWRDVQSLPIPGPICYNFLGAVWHIDNRGQRGFDGTGVDSRWGAWIIGTARQKELNPVGAQSTTVNRRELARRRGKPRGFVCWHHSR